MNRLAGYVHVRDEVGSSHVFGPASDVPAWAVPLITNAKAWADKLTPSAGSAPSRPAGNSGADKWLAYAAAVGVDVPADASEDRDAIKALIKAKEEA